MRFALLDRVLAQDAETEESEQQEQNTQEKAETFFQENQGRFLDVASEKDLGEIKTFAFVGDQVLLIGEYRGVLMDMELNDGESFDLIEIQDEAEEPEQDAETEDTEEVEPADETGEAGDAEDSADSE